MRIWVPYAAEGSVLQFASFLVDIMCMLELQIVVIEESCLRTDSSSLAEIMCMHASHGGGQFAGVNFLCHLFLLVCVVRLVFHVTFT
mmetsp:Transcript_25346/g.68862  ORF Transcript_25346/g.68862 Transcript_25346/m.68862 type:complete len:87 (+) Transcript_25346:1268-1528(+)